MDTKYKPVTSPRHIDESADRSAVAVDHHTHQQRDGSTGRSSTGSLTEVDESLLGDDRKWTKRRGAIDQHDDDDDEDDSCGGDGLRQRCRRRRGACKRVVGWLRWGLDTLLLLAILGLLVHHQAASSTATSKRLDFGSDFTGVGPQIDQRITRFKSDQSYAPMNMSLFFTEEVLQKWNHLMPVGMGFVWVNDTHRYHDLPTPIDWPDKTVFTTSVTHQIHCLFTIAQTYAGLSSGHDIPPDHHWHMVHCIDYMREAVLCSADMALEGHETTFPDDNGGSDGWDSTHVCKDYSQVKKYLESVRAYDDQLIY